MSLSTIVNGAFQAIYLLVFARIVVSFLQAFMRIDPYNPIVKFIYEVTEPIMAPFRRLLPPVGGMDFSPILLFIVLQILQNLILSWV